MTVDPYIQLQDQAPKASGSLPPSEDDVVYPRPSLSLAITLIAILLTTALAPMPSSAQSDDPADGAATLTPIGETIEGADSETGVAGAVAASADPEITFPVVGPVNFSDTWGACRGIGCSRGHKGVDVFGHKLAPLVAADDGVITFERRSGLTISGNTVIIENDAGWRFLYIHLNNDAPGTDDGSNPQGWIIPNRLRAGDRVEAGQVIGYLGDSGNAETTPAHVHFEIHAPGIGAINPTPFVQEAKDAGRTISVASLASTPEGRAESAPTVVAWYKALLKREPTDMELFAWTDRFDIDFATTDDLIADLTMAKQRRDPAGAVVRSFRVALDRLPSLNELRQWEVAYRDGTDLADIAAVLIGSGQFANTHGTLSDADFVRVIYRNAIGVDPSEERLDDWLTAMADGTSRSEVSAALADSYSVKNSTWHGLEVIQAYRASLDRLPDSEEYALWVAHLDSGGLIPDVVEAIRANR